MDAVNAQCEHTQNIHCKTCKKDIFRLSFISHTFEASLELAIKCTANVMVISIYFSNQMIAIYYLISNEMETAFKPNTNLQIARRIRLA